ncbi:U-box domain-containing protein 24-like [Syzygium oleosum]|uniref:U-box domain-containing protein 24-like n=1 Tax=Syzygium oleosum TaxID=219896 RepID=UPI0024BB0A72|nr:U-box domain-containing protein 24-like [Syzygium oleosum]
MEAKENALSALFRFTDPANVESQRIVVEQGVYPLLVNFLRVGSVTAKARAAALIGNLSMSTPRLVMATKPSFCWCFSARVHLCPAHGSKCSVASTFCLLEANALPDLDELLRIQVHATAYDAIQAPSMLVREGSPNRGASTLHKANAIKPLLEIFTWRMDSLKEEALGFLEKIFHSKDIVEHYGSTAKLLLVGMTGRNIHDESHIGRRAARVLSLL